LKKKKSDGGAEGRKDRNLTKRIKTKIRESGAGKESGDEILEHE